MMARFFASIPFWILALMFLVAGLAWLLDDKEPSSKRGGNFAMSMLVSGAFAVIAAFIMG